MSIARLLRGVGEPSSGGSEDKVMKETIETKLQKLNISTVADLLSLKCDGPMGLLRGAGLDQHEYEFLHDALMHKGNNKLKPKSAKEIFVQQKQSMILDNEKWPTTSRVFPPGMVTELTGPCFVGKSLVTLDLAIRSIVNALECSQDDRPIRALYVDIKKKLHENERRDVESVAHEILQRLRANSQSNQSQSHVFEVSDVLGCLVVVSIESFTELLNWIESDEFATLTAENCIAAIVIDSLSTLAVVDKAQHLSDEMEVTPDSLLRLGSLLNQVASVLACPVVATTTVRDGLFKSSAANSANMTVDAWEAQFPMAPSLQYCVHARLILLYSQYPDLTVGGDSQGSAERCLLLEKHPFLAQRPLLFDLNRMEELYNQ